MNDAPGTTLAGRTARRAADPAPTGRTDVTELTSGPDPAPAPGAPEPPPESRGHMVRRRVLTLLLIVLLIGVPAGYLVISADQSHQSSVDHEAQTEARGLIAGAPSKVQQRLYNVRLPARHAAAMSYETNNWRTSRLYVQFITTPRGLNSFLTAMGTGTGALQKNDLPISARDRSVASWDFSGTGDWRGLVHHEARPRPTQRVVVDYANPRYPQVYVVSSTTP